ncbi:argininosuccinate lyase [Paenibacillus sp. PL91]|uniref:argininosuccinate lyase n=1 Tax=Paenibacillus sp. PL91 TaxID=2729538 RepID=UPI00145C8EBD|nr:argininosuccinate lyase [Paenibacillus sp. PL91]MBC9200536.1 argininosuccinate lyase [Paenibacillus sp. PL91]
MSINRLEQDEGSTFPGRTYAEAVLAPAYDQAKQELLQPMIAVHKAHLIMLFEQGLLTRDEAHRIANALLTIDLEQLRRGKYNGQFEDLFFEVEHKLLELSGEASGSLHLARSRNDMGISIYRITLRGKLLRAIGSALELHASLLALAKKHTDTIMIAHTHTQQAQPTTLAHYIAAVTDSLARDIRRLQAAYGNCNLSSMGAAALTTSGFAISRERVAWLLAFDGLIDNAYDAVSGADYAGEIASAVQLAAINLGRFTQELLLWCTQEFAVAQVADPYVQISSIMPQKRNPVSLEHIRSLLSSIAGNAQTVLTMIHNTPFGDIVDTEDDMQPYAWKSLDTLEAVYRLLSKVISTLHIKEDVLQKRAADSFATVTELADTLVREEGLSFRKAHSVVSKLVTIAAQRGDHLSDLSLHALNEAAVQTIGIPLRLSEQQLKQALDPNHFVHIRTLRGGPSPTEMNRSLDAQQKRLLGLNLWLKERAAKLEAAAAELNLILSGWLSKES